jgi:hypothetical protein
MLKFCFPEREADENEMGDDNEGGKKSRILSKGKETNFYVPIERKDDVEKMKVFKYLKYFCNIFYLSIVYITIFP